MLLRSVKRRSSARQRCAFTMTLEGNGPEPGKSGERERERFMAGELPRNSSLVCFVVFRSQPYALVVIVVELDLVDCVFIILCVCWCEEIPLAVKRAFLVGSREL